MSYKTLKMYFYSIWFLNGFFIWYAIDKIFFEQNGISIQQIVILGALAWVPQLIFEVPSSVMADRWSRKGVILLGEVGFILGSFVLGIGSEFWHFAIGIMVWSFANSMISGTSEALLYDSLKNIKTEGTYQKLSGNCNSLLLLGMFSAGLASVLVARFFDLRLAFFLTIPALIIATLLVAKIKEPPISRTSHKNLTWFDHSKSVLRSLNSKLLRWTALLMVFAVAFRSTVYEYYQILLVEKNFGVESIAIIFSVIVFCMALASYIFGKIQINKQILMFVWFLFGLTTTAGLVSLNKVIIVLDLVLLFALMKYLNLYLDYIIQNRVDSSMRASVLSFTSSIGQAVFLLYAIVIYFVVDYLGMAGSISLASVLLIALGVVEIKRIRNKDLKLS